MRCMFKCFFADGCWGKFTAGKQAVTAKDPYLSIQIRTSDVLPLYSPWPPGTEKSVAHKPWYMYECPDWNSICTKWHCVQSHRGEIQPSSMMASVCVCTESNQRENEAGLLLMAARRLPEAHPFQKILKEPGEHVWRVWTHEKKLFCWRTTFASFEYSVCKKWSICLHYLEIPIRNSTLVAHAPWGKWKATDGSLIPRPVH